MAIVTKPVTIQSGGEDAVHFRRLFYATMGGRPGVIGEGDFAVTQNGTPNMSVNVADGRCFVLGSESAEQGLYLLDNRNTQNVTITAAHATLGRYDLIVARVRDAAYSGASNSAAIEAIAGTPAASPVVPATPANCLVVARVLVGAAVTTILTAAITDARSGGAGYTAQGGRAAALGGVIPCSSAARPTVGLYDGMLAYEVDLDRFIAYQGSSWVEYGHVSVWDSTFVPVITQSITVSKTTGWCRHNKIGRYVRYQGYVSMTSTGTTNQPVRISLPYTAAIAGPTVGEFYWFCGPSNPLYTNVNVFTAAYVATTTQLGGLVSGQGIVMGQTGGGWPNQLTSGDSLLWSVGYEATA